MSSEMLEIFNSEAACVNMSLSCSRCLHNVWLKGSCAYQGPRITGLLALLKSFYSCGLPLHTNLFIVSHLLSF